MACLRFPISLENFKILKFFNLWALRARVLKMHRHAVYHCLKEVQKPFRHASVFKTRVSTRACPYLKRAFSPIKLQRGRLQKARSGMSYTLAVHSLSLDSQVEREPSTSASANLSRGLATFSRDLAKFKREFAKFRGLLGTGPPNPALESHPQGPIWYRNRARSGNRCRINVKSMLNRCHIDPWGGEAEADSRETYHRVPPSKTSFGGLRKWDSSGLCPFPLRKITGKPGNSLLNHFWVTFKFSRVSGELGGAARITTSKTFLGRGFMVCFPLPWLFHPALLFSEGGLLQKTS